MEFNNEKIDYTYLQKVVSEKASESKVLEFKAKEDFLKDINGDFALAVSAMANEGGGLIIYGIKTSRRNTINGNEEDYANELDPFDLSTERITYQSFVDTLKNRIDPTPELEIEMINETDKENLVYFCVLVKESFRVPHMFVNKEKVAEKISGKYYWRDFNGSKNQMTDYQIRKLMESQQKTKISSEIFYHLSQNGINFWIDIKNTGRTYFESTMISLVTINKYKLRKKFLDDSQNKWYEMSHLGSNLTSFKYFDNKIRFNNSSEPFVSLDLIYNPYNLPDDIFRAVVEIQGKGANPFYGIINFTPKINDTSRKIEIKECTFQEFKDEAKKIV